MWPREGVKTEVGHEESIAPRSSVRLVLAFAVKVVVTARK